jgi:hypothetical protein
MKQVDEMPTSGRFAVVWQGVDCLMLKTQQEKLQ